MEIPKRDRLREIYRRLADAPPSTTFDEMFSQLASILEAVEDELTGIPNDPNNWRWDNRIYPPQRDSCERSGWMGGVYGSWTRREPVLVEDAEMNALECLRERLEARFPDAKLSIDRAETATGSWFLDATLKGYELVVEWRPDRGFGISTPSPDDYGAKPDEVYEDVDAAFERTKALLLSQTPTRPPLRATLPELREARKLSQTELASRLSINQGACSRMERRGDMLVGTLRNVVAAMGGELHLVAEFPDRTVYIDLDALDARNDSTAPESSAA